MESMGRIVPSAAIIVMPKKAVFIEHDVVPVNCTTKVVNPPRLVVGAVRALVSSGRNSTPSHTGTFVGAGVDCGGGGRPLAPVLTPASFHGTGTGTGAEVGASAAPVPLTANPVEGAVLPAEGTDRVPVDGDGAEVAHPVTDSNNITPISGTNFGRILITSRSVGMEHFLC